MAVTAVLPLPMARYTSPSSGIAMSPPKPDASTAMLVGARPEAFAAGLERLLEDPVLAARLGREGRAHGREP